QGVPMLCVTADSSNRPRMNHQQNRFQGPAILVIDELDTWRIPEPPESVEGGMQAFVLANMTRGAREAINLIRSAVEDPNVIVLATSTIGGEVDPFFYEVLEPLTIIDIANPNEQERADIWAEIMQDHPSTRSLDANDLVKFSAGLARYDIYIAAREAIEEAYKAGLVQRSFVPVTSQNILDKIAACQPLDSDEYHALEDRVISDFVDSLDDLEQLLDDQHE
ncbi:MAG: ribonucleotide reductase subunit alpha, partial [Eggerthellaceae bacterium]|nr:ribonucleotide reductase subunit alpha [Eggerthellaceae bacterium]